MLNFTKCESIKNIVPAKSNPTSFRFTASTKTPSIAPNTKSNIQVLAISF